MGRIGNVWVVALGAIAVGLATGAHGQPVNESGRGRDFLLRAVESSDLFATEPSKLTAALANIDSGLTQTFTPVKDWAGTYWSTVESRSGGRLDVDGFRGPIAGIIASHGVLVAKVDVARQVYDYVSRDASSGKPDLPYKHDRERLRDAAQGVVAASRDFESQVRTAMSAARDRHSSLTGQVQPLYRAVRDAGDARSRCQTELSTLFQDNARAVEEWGQSFKRLADLDRSANEMCAELIREEEAERTDFRKVTDLESKISQVVGEAQRAVARERELRGSIRGAFDRINAVEDSLKAAQDNEAAARAKLVPVEPDYERALIVYAGLQSVYRE